MPLQGCGGSCRGDLNLRGGVLIFSFEALSPPIRGDVRGFAAAEPAEAESVWTPADMERFTGKVQAFYDGLPADEQVVLEALLRQGGEGGVLR